MPIRVLLADDHSLFREGLRSLLDAQRDIEVIGEAQDGQQIVQLVKEEVPDIIVMDVTMPGLNGIEATRHIMLAAPDARVLCLSMHSESRLAEAMAEAGAAGYLLKDCSPNELIKAIRRVAQGKTHFHISGQGSGGYRPPMSSDSAFTRLTDREREVLQLFAEGCTTKEIADRLNVSPKTISTHREHIMEKLNMRSVAELTKYAIREGITSL